MKRLLVAVALVAASFCVPRPASATCGALPFVFANNTSLVDANTTNANNAFLQACANNVDNTQIGPAGIFASQIKPTSAAQATFGGGWTWKFNGPSNSTGIVNLSSPGFGNTALQIVPTLNDNPSNGSWMLQTMLYSNLSTTAAGIDTNGTFISFYGGFTGAGAPFAQSTTTNSFVAQTQTTGARVAFILDNNNVSPVSGDIADFRLNGSTKFAIQNSGVPTWTGALGTVQGGTGSTTQNFVDLTTAQTVAGVKTFSSAPVMSGASITTATIPRASLVTMTASRTVVTDGSGNDTVAADLPVLVSTAQSIAGTKTFTVPVQGESDSSHAAYLPPVYNHSGAALASTTHIVADSVSATGTGAQQNITVTLTGASIFAAVPPFAIMGCTDTTSGTTTLASWAQTSSSGSSLVFQVTLTNTHTATCGYIAIGA